MSLQSDIAAIRKRVKDFQDFRAEAKGQVQKLYDHLEQTTQAPVTMGPPGQSDNGKPRRSQAENLWMGQVPQMKAAIDSTLVPKIKALETRLTELCDQSGWIGTMRTEATEWQSVSKKVDTAMASVEPASLKCDESWKGGAGDGYRTKAAAQRTAMLGAGRAAEAMHNGCIRAASAGEGFFYMVNSHVSGLSTNVSIGSNACYVLPPLSVFTTELPGMYGAAVTAIDTSMTNLETSVGEGFTRVRPKSQGGTGLPDDTIDVSSDLKPWPAA